MFHINTCNKIVALVFIAIISCKSKSYFDLSKDSSYFEKSLKKNKKLSSKEWKNWSQKDICEDTIPGISLEKAYDFLKNKNPDTIVVALIDGRVDVSHEDIQNALFINTKEIPSNSIDDDNNGYIDDVNGWNFLGNKNGKQLYRANFEYTRILKEYEPIFKYKNESDIPIKDKTKYQSYLRALNTYNKRLQLTHENIQYLDSLISAEEKLQNEFTLLYPNTNFNDEFLDSIKNKSPNLKKKIDDFKSLLKNSNWVKNRIQSEKRYFTIYLNKNDNDREVIGDNSSELNDINYGNNKISTDSSNAKHTHGIKMLGIIAADRNNEKGIKGVTNLVKIMPLAVAPYGDSHDKDIALAIRYAVNNGAKVINMSIGRSFSLHEDWVNNALKYAEKHDVLVITSSGNKSLNLDKDFNYPNDAISHSDEFINNFIKVGGSTCKVNENLAYSSSNYGKKEVDIFAPAEYIYTTKNDNNYDYSSGTSCSSAMVTGVAALIRSHYPNLTAAEVKQIIMESGVSYNIMVNKPSTSEEKELVPFSSLSKSGKIVNAYNALLMAEEVSKKKKKKKRN